MLTTKKELLSGMHRSGKEEAMRRGGAVHGAFSAREAVKTEAERGVPTEGRAVPGVRVPPHIR